MKTRLNPSYNAEMNADAKAITIVRHVPILPPASGIYANDILFSAKKKVILDDGTEKIVPDLCFYHEILQDDIWTWQRVTYGINRQYVIPVSRLIGDTYTFDDVVDRINLIIKWMVERYDEIFDPIKKTSDLGVNEINAILKYNEIATYINTICSPKVPFEMADPEEDGTSAQDFGSIFMNKLITFLNPYADYTERQDKIVATLKMLNPSNPTSSIQALVDLANTL